MNSNLWGVIKKIPFNISAGNKKKIKGRNFRENPGTLGNKFDQIFDQVFFDSFYFPLTLLLDISVWKIRDNEKFLYDQNW